MSEQEVALVESKSSHSRLATFTSKYKAKIDSPIVLHTKDLAVKNGVTCLPLYMAPML